VTPQRADASPVHENYGAVFQFAGAALELGEPSLSRVVVVGVIEACDEIVRQPRTFRPGKDQCVRMHTRVTRASHAQTLPSSYVRRMS